MIVTTLDAVAGRITEQMHEQARKLGADAIVGVRLEVIEMSNGIYCVNACGTAVKLAIAPRSMPPVTGHVHVAIDPLIAYAGARPSVAGSDLRH